MQEVKDLFMVSANGQLYNEAMLAMAAARKAKQAELAKAIAAKKKFWKDVKEIGAVVAVLVFLVPMCLAILIGYLTK